MAALNAIAFATALTTITAFRFRSWRKPWMVVAYFLMIATAELIGELYWIPEGTIPPVTAAVLFGIAALFGGAHYAIHRLERAEAGPRRDS